MIGGKQAASSGRQYYICTTQINCRIPTQIKFQSDHESDSVYVLLVIALVGCSLFLFQIFPSVDFSVLLVRRFYFLLSSTVALLFFYCAFRGADGACRCSCGRSPRSHGVLGTRSPTVAVIKADEACFVFSRGSSMQSDHRFNSGLHST
jgi:hypothetical protein